MAADVERSARVVTRIVEQHHAHERGALPYIVSLLAKVAGRYRARDGRLDALCDLGQDLADTLEAYMDEDERRLLPALAAGGSDVVRGEVDRRNRELLALLLHLRALASEYVAPDWADQDYRALLEELQGLEDSVVERTHVASHVLVGPLPPPPVDPDEPLDRAASAALRVR